MEEFNNLSEREKNWMQKFVDISKGTMYTLLLWGFMFVANQGMAQTAPHAITPPKAPATTVVKNPTAPARTPANTVPFSGTVTTNQTTEAATPSTKLTQAEINAFQKDLGTWGKDSTAWRAAGNFIKNDGIDHSWSWD